MAYTTASNNFTTDQSVSGNISASSAAIANSITASVVGVSSVPASGNLFTVGASTLVVAQNGNVGIGTASPRVALDVNGVGLFMSPNAGTSGGVSIRDNTSNSGDYLQFVNNAANSQYGYIQGSPAGLALMGNYVGIGTASPASPLYVYNSAGGRLAYFAGSSSGADAIEVGYGGGSNQSMEMGFNPNGGSPFGYLAILGGDPALSIDASGNISTPGCLTYNGGTLGSCLSDMRLKKDIKSLTGAAEKISHLNPVSFKWRRKAATEGPVNHGTQYGLIAQQVEKVAPDLVVKDKKTGYRHVIYGSELNMMMIEAIKEQQGEIENLKAIVCADHPRSRICDGK